MTNTTIKIIKNSELSNLIIPDIKLIDQKKIAEISMFLSKDIELINKKVNLKNKYKKELLNIY